MNYSEKLKDPQWIRFREELIWARRQSRPDYGRDVCDDCGQDTIGTLHVHHKRYIKGREPWQYDYDDLRLLCESCHDLIHDAEDDARQFIRSLPPYACNEWRYLMDELISARNISVHALQIACAHAKNSIRNAMRGYLEDRDKPVSASMVQTMAELEADYIREKRGQK